MTFIPENKLEESLVKAQSDPAFIPQFYKEFVVSNIFIIQEGLGPEKAGPRTLKEGESLQIRHIDHMGKACVPVFSSLLRLQKFVNKEVGYLAGNALEFMKIFRGADIILNPGADYGKEFTKGEIESIIDGTIGQSKDRYVADKPVQVQIGQPANYPKELVQGLSRYFEQTKEVKKAYLAHFLNPERDKKAHTLVGIQVSGNWNAVSAGVGMVVSNVFVPDPPVDVIQITGKGGVEDYFIKKCKPFYEKKILGLF